MTMPNTPEGPILQVRLEQTPPKKAKKAKPLTRAQRWAAACTAAQQALSDLQALQDEFEEWHEKYPENAQSSPTYEKLQTIVDLDIDGALETVNDAEQAEVPLGFGRD